MSTYGGADAYPDLLTLPGDTEPATAASLVDPIKLLADRTNFLLRRMASMSPSFNPCRLSSRNGTTVIVNTVAGVVMFDSAPHYETVASESTTLDKTFIEGLPGDFFGSRHYYVYKKVGGWEISETPPDMYGFKQGGFTTHRYLGAFRTDAGARIVPFQRVRGMTLYHRPFRVLLAGTDIVKQPVDLSGVIPFRSAEAIIRVLGNTNVAFPAEVKFGPQGFDPATDGYSLNIEGSSFETAVYIVPIGADGSRKLEYLVDAATTSATLDVLGYYE